AVRGRCRRESRRRRFASLAAGPRRPLRPRLSLRDRLATQRRAAYAGRMAGRRVVGRGRELARTEAFVAAAGSGPAALTLIGDAGIGKTTVWEEGIRHAEARGCTVLRCRAAEQEETLAYVGLSDLLVAGDAVLPRLPRPQGAALSAALMLSDGESPDQRAV